MCASTRRLAVLLFGCLWFGCLLLSTGLYGFDVESLCPHCGQAD